MTIDTPEFRLKLPMLLPEHKENWMQLVIYIDAKLAQAREEGILFERKRLVQTIGNANDLSSECLKQRDEANARAINAESRLAEIQRGVDGLQRWRDEELCYGKPDIAMLESTSGEYLKRQDVLDLFDKK